MAVSQVALAGLAVVALVLTVVATARDRSRTLHVLRTLGLDAGTARRLSAGEVLPLLVAGLVAGSAIGFVVPWLLTSALGLSALTGEPDGTRLAIAWQPVAIAAGRCVFRTAHLSGSCPQFISEYRQGVSLTSPDGRCARWRCT